MEDNKIIFLLSIVITTIIFFYAKFDKVIKINFYYKLKFNYPSYYRIIPEREFVSLQLEGKAKNLILEAIRNKEISINIEGFSKPISYIKLSDYIPEKTEFKVLKIIPESISISLEKLVQKRREVKVIIKGNIEENYKIDSIKYEPNFVDVFGPESELLSSPFIETYEIDITNKKETFKVSVPLRKMYNDIQISPESVNVEVFISKIKD
jgi:hypothetical protein